MGSHFPRGIRPSAHASHRLLTLHPKSCSLFALTTIWITKSVRRRASVTTKRIRQPRRETPSAIVLAYVVVALSAILTVSVFASVRRVTTTELLRGRERVVGAVYLHPADKYSRLTRPTVTGAKRHSLGGYHGLPAALSPVVTPSQPAAWTHVASSGHLPVPL